MAKKKVGKKKVTTADGTVGMKRGVEEKIPYAANAGRVMNKSGIVGDGALVKPEE